MDLLPASEIGVPWVLDARRQQFVAQDSAGQHIQAHIDGLVLEVFPHVVRLHAVEPSGNLVGPTALRQLRPHILHSRGQGGYVVAVADGPSSMPGYAPCRYDMLPPSVGGNPNYSPDLALGSRSTRLWLL